MLSADLPTYQSRTSRGKILVFAGFLVLGMVAAFMVATSHPHNASSSQLNLQNRRDLFNQWKLTFGKHYHNRAEEELRFGVWCENYDWIRIHNLNPFHTYRVGLNKFADLKREEFASAYANCLNNVRIKPNGQKATGVKVPASVDWRQKNAVTPVKNQGQCGSCWSFSTTGSLEGLNAITNGNLLSFSEQQLVDCSDSYGNQGCNGGLMDDAFEYVQAKGIELESQYPYDAEQGKCKYADSDVKFQNTGHTDVAANDQEALAEAVAQQPISIGIEADQNVFQLYDGGIINSASCGTTIDHGVLIVGYGSEGSQDYWIVKNSWGASWGEQGYVRIEKTNAKGPGICGLAQIPSYPTGSASPKPGPNHHEEGEEGNEGGEENCELSK